MTTDPATRRFLIVAGCYADAAPAISLAEALARALPSALAGSLSGVLVGVLVRQPALDYAEGAPVLSAPRLSLQPEALTHERLTQAYAADARAFSSRLSLIASRARLTWEFRTDSGMTVDLACRIRRPNDTVLVGYRRFLNTHGPVVALCRADDHRTQELAASLARTLHRRALSLPIEAADQTGLIEEMSATALIVSSELARQSARLSALIEAARCPVLVAPDEG